MTKVGHEVFETNSIIRASAGTGKTFALATRFIRLMLIDGVKPETIVALTFSRAAAQEIYTKILERLCKAAIDGADEEWNRLLEDYREGNIANGEGKLAAILANPPPHGKDDFARLLRALVDTQHLGAIATLDSFILKIVRNFPKEMGVQNAISVLDPIDEDAAINEAVRSALSTSDDMKSPIAEAFIAAQKGEYSRQCLSAIESILAQQGWRNFVLSHHKCNQWTVASMAKELGVDLNSVCPDLSQINNAGRYNPIDKFREYATAYDGTTEIFLNDRCKDMMLTLWENPSATAYGWSAESGAERRFEYGAEGAAAIRAAIRHMMNVYLKRQLEIVEAKIKLVEAVEQEYERMTRRMGKLTFADFTKYSAEEASSERHIAIENVEFRFDSKFDHWALDEFQDTSELQWRCLKELVRNAAEDGCNGGDRTAMVVGDMKQSIYTWRGASARPFEEIAAWPAFNGFERDFVESHRYGPNIADFVNKVFGVHNIKMSEWQKGWRDHVSKEAADYVKVVAAEKCDDDEADSKLLPALYAELAPFWQRHCDEKSVDTVGILVRSNDDGLKVAEYLRSKGMHDIVWEGMSPCGDDQLVQAILALLKLADHPSDTEAWKIVNELTAIRETLLPDCDSCAEASATISRMLTQQGLSRTLKDWCGRFDNEKLRRLVELAVSFESRATGDMLAFAEFVEKSGKREIASSPDVIRVMTIHRSKGLGIDHVFVPIFEKGRAKSAINACKTSMPLFDGGEWVLSHLTKGSEQFNAKTKAAYEKMCSERFLESLRTYYVALTRAKKSMVVLLTRDNATENTDQGLLMSDLIISAVGNVLPYEAGSAPSLKAKKKDDDKRHHTTWSISEANEPIKRVTPSHGAGVSFGARKAADFFDVDFGDATQKGIEAHAKYALIEWIDPNAPQSELEQRILASEFREAFVKPSPNATIWRERNYESFDEATKVWESGQFDRVVFTDDGKAATIYDFKTNHRRADESPIEFAERLRALYASQLSAYRQSLSRLTKIPLERISTVLLAEATGQVVIVQTPSKPTKP